MGEGRGSDSDFRLGSAEPAGMMDRGYRLRLGGIDPAGMKERKRRFGSGNADPVWIPEKENGRAGRTNRRGWSPITLFLVLLLSLVLSGAVLADEITVQMVGKYHQTDARSMLQLINDFRTGPDAWQLKKPGDGEADRTRDQGGAIEYVTGLSPLVYDYSLERMAMLRAMETALFWDHIRPSGTTPFSAYPGYANIFYAMGENIACGYNSVKSSAGENGAFILWREDDCNYAGQGHRRNMLNKNYTAVGIAHVSHNGCEYWVQEFGNPAVDTTATAASDDLMSANVTFTTDNIQDSSGYLCAINGFSLKTGWGYGPLEVAFGKSVTLPEILVRVSNAGTSSYYYNALMKADLVFEMADSGIAEISADQKTVTGKKAGTTLAAADFAGEKLSFEVTVTPADLSDASIAKIADKTYTGKAVCPQPTVTLNGTTLISGTDYTVSWSDNKDAGTATVTVTGTGNYQGTLSTTFRIAPLSLTDASLNTSIDKIKAQAFTGKSVKPEVTVTAGGRTLEEGTDYKLSWSNNKGVGTAAVKVTGQGNYTGTLTRSFSIVLRKGVTILDKSTGAYYKVTKGGTSGKAEAAYMKPSKAAKTVTIPATVKVSTVTCKVTTIASGAFKDRTKMKKVVIGKNVRTIGKGAFKGCKNLKQIDIRTKLLTASGVKAGAFKNINAKAAFTLPSAKKKAYKKILLGKGATKEMTFK